MQVPQTRQFQLFFCPDSSTLLDDDNPAHRPRRARNGRPASAVGPSAGVGPIELVFRTIDNWLGQIWRAYRRDRDLSACGRIRVFGFASSEFRLTDYSNVYLAMHRAAAVARHVTERPAASRLSGGSATERRRFLNAVVEACIDFNPSPDDPAPLRPVTGTGAPDPLSRFVWVEFDPPPRQRPPAREICGPGDWDAWALSIEEVEQTSIFDLRAGDVILEKVTVTLMRRHPGALSDPRYRNGPHEWRTLRYVGVGVSIDPIGRVQGHVEDNLPEFIAERLNSLIDDTIAAELEPDHWVGLKFCPARQAARGRALEWADWQGAGGSTVGPVLSFRGPAPTTGRIVHFDFTGENPYRGTLFFATNGIVSWLGRDGVRRLEQAAEISGLDWASWLTEPDQTSDWVYLTEPESQGLFEGAFPVDDDALVEGAWGRFSIVPR